MKTYNKLARCFYAQFRVSPVGCSLHRFGRLDVPIIIFIIYFGVAAAAIECFSSVETLLEGRKQ